MKLALNLGYWSGEAATNTANIELALEAERLGFDSVWAAEAYGSDAATVLSWIGAKTERIGLGSAIFQIPGRTPALTSMTAATLDALSGGRFRLGIGVSGPQVSEGWHGVRFDAPLARTREYLEVLRMALGREVVKHDGVHYPLPLPDGPGRALRLTIHPVRDEIPILLAAVGPKNLELAGELADGWLAVFLAPDFAPEQISHIQTGRDKVGKTMEGFEIVGPSFVVTGNNEEELERAAVGTRKQIAFYGSTPAYRPVLEMHGWGEVQDQLNVMSKQGEWDKMGTLITDEILNTFAVVGLPEQIAPELHHRYGDVIQRISFYAPYSSDPERWSKVMSALQSA